MEPGFRREFLAIMASDLMTKYHDGTTKIDADETAGEERHLRHKRTKYHLGSPVTSTAFSPGFLLDPFEETSPLGLTLKKTPSFIELIQMNLSEGDSAAPLAINNSSLEVGRKNESKCAPGPAIADKYKASNFPALVLRIGSWERISRYEGDLVVKCYDAKRKLVWEVLEGGLKSKMEIHWSDITSLKTSCRDNEPGTLEIEVSRCPLFFRETDPQPRKHTIWQPTSDFTGGQASRCRRHLLQFAQGRLERYHEKLLQCEHHLNLLRKEGIMSGDCPYFDSSGEVFQDQNEHRCYGATYKQKSQLFLESDRLTDSYLPPFWSLPDRRTPGVSSMVQKIEPPELDGRVLDAAPQDTPSPCSASVTMDSWATEESGITSDDDLHVNATANCEQMIFVTPYGGLRNQGCDLLSPKSMDLLPVNETVSCSSEKKGFHNSVPTIEETWQANKRILDDIADHLLGDSLLSATFDEQNVIAHINSMCSVIENDVSALHASNGNTESLENSGAGRGSGRLAKGEDDGQVYEINDHMTGAGLSRDDRLNSHVMEDDYILCRQSSGFLRQDSLADLAVNIPWIASFPQLFDDSSDQFIMSAEQTGIAGWKLFE